VLGYHSTLEITSTSTVETTVCQTVVGGTTVLVKVVGFGTVVGGTIVVGLYDPGVGVTICPPTNVPLTQVQFYGK